MSIFSVICFVLEEKEKIDLESEIWFGIFSHIAQLYLNSALMLFCMEVQKSPKKKKLYTLRIKIQKHTYTKIKWKN